MEGYAKTKLLTILVLLLVMVVVTSIISPIPNQTLDSVKVR